MKQLYLSGGGDDLDTRILSDLIMTLKSDQKVLYIPIAWKGGDYKKCEMWFRKKCFSLNFDNFDTLFSLDDDIVNHLNDYEFIFIGGGNTFFLLEQFKKTGFDKLLLDFIDTGKIVYGGSAGAIIMGRDIKTASFGKDADRNDVNLVDLHGLDLVNGYSIQAHYELSEKEELQNFVDNKDVKIIALSEETGLKVIDDEIIIIGEKPVYIFEKNQKYKEVSFNGRISVF